MKLLTLIAVTCCVALTSTAAFADSPSNSLVMKTKQASDALMDDGALTAVLDDTQMSGPASSVYFCGYIPQQGTTMAQDCWSLTSDCAKLDLNSSPKACCSAESKLMPKPRSFSNC
jgi:hypothetical protein